MKENGISNESIFLLPFLNINKNNFITISSIDQNRPSLDRNFFIVYKLDNINNIINAKEEYKNLEIYINEKEYRINKNFYNVFTFKVPDNIEEDYIHYISNDHNKISESVKNTIITYWKKNNIDVNYIFNNNIVNDIIPHCDYIESIHDIIERRYESINILDDKRNTDEI